MKRAAVIGLGTISKTHIDAILADPNVELCAACDSDPDKQKQLPFDIPFYEDYHVMLRQEQPDCVHICLPHYLHVPVSMEAAGLGIHVFCEKPVALNAQEAERFVEFEQENPDIHIGICLQNRRNRTVECLKELIESGQYGRITGCRGLVLWARPKSYYEESPWRGKWETAGGGCMINQSVHTLDLLYYLCGNVHSLKSSVSQLLEYGIEVEDTVAARLVFADQAQGLFFATNANSQNESVQISVSMEKADFSIEESCLYRIDKNGEKTRICEDEKLPGSRFYYGASHRKLIHEFYDALEKNNDHYIHVRDAWMSIKLIDAIQTSSQKNETVIVSE